MADRQEIDALIVGALYGELDAADRARLESHLSSHPEDRAALEALERTRATVRRGLADMPSAEPSPAISTILLREAGRLAPTPRAAGARESAEEDGLWARFLRWARPVAMHPAFAGAAALILVAGTASALWLRDKGEVTEPSVQTAEPERAPMQDDFQDKHAAADQPGAAPAVPPALEGDYRVDLDQGGAGKDTAAENTDRNMAAELRGRDAVAMPADGKKGPAKSTGKSKGKEKRPEAAGYLELGSSKDSALDIKDLDETSKAEEKKRDEDSILEAEDDAVTSRGAKVAKQGQAAPKPEPKPVDPALEEWAKGAHSRLAKLVADGKCPEAGRLGAEIKDRAPEYYAANVANDRAIRACKSYIEGQAKKKAEKNYKSRSQSNTYDDEAAADSK